MKIVTYNVNGLRRRVSQHGSLLKLLNSLDADIICLQETKLQRRALSVDVTMAEGYEAFVSCSRTSCKGRLSYSGVATFCRVKSAFSTKEAALPLAAEEGFTGLLESPKKQGIFVDNFIKTSDVEGPEHATIADILKVDSEGRCIITDHGHFVLFNLYGPQADIDDKERTHFKLLFFRLLQRRWDSLLSQGKRVVVVGDLNIAPAPIDRCDAEPEFEKNIFRTWLRSMLRECDGPFVDAFRSKHPYRKDAYTCFSPRIGAEEFNYGSRIDHILIAGSCLHGHHCLERNLFDCHVERCDIMLQFLRGNFGGTKWNGGRSKKLQGSDHLPVYVMLNDMPDLPLHNTPALAVRYVPEVHGQQQTIVSFLSKRCVPDANENPALLKILLGESVAAENVEGSVASWDNSMSLKCGKVADSTHISFYFGHCSSEYVDHRISKEICTESNKHTTSGLAVERNSFLHNAETPVKKVKSTAYSQVTLKSFFHKQKPSTDCNINKKNPVTSHDLYDNGVKSDEVSHRADFAAVKNPLPDVEDHIDENISRIDSNAQDQVDTASCFSFKTKKVNMALLEWQRIQQKMKVSIPLCKGHSEPCVARSVKKEGPNIGQRFYVCARAQGPLANPEANCGHFEWANKRSSHRK